MEKRLKIHKNLNEELKKSKKSKPNNKINKIKKKF